MKRTKKKLELKTQTVTTLTAKRLEKVRGGGDSLTDSNCGCGSTYGNSYNCFEDVW